MKDRIQQFIDFKGISPGDLAAALDVQRSNISHILNGRNKPGAAFIEKFLVTYPDLNARWLLTGQGDMVNSAPTPSRGYSDASPELKEDAQEDTTESKGKSSSTVKNSSNATGTNDDVEKVIILNTNGTFTIYNPGK